MCRNITELRGLEPPATRAEVEAAALQYVRKVSGLRTPPPGVAGEYAAAVAAITRATTELLASLPARRQPPPTVPPLRRPEVRARLAAQQARSASSPAPAATDHGEPRPQQGEGRRGQSLEP